MSKGAREVMRRVKNAVDDAGSDLNLRLAQLMDNITEHLDTVVKKVKDTDNFDNTVTTRRRNTKTTHYDPANGRPVQEEGTILDDFGGTERGDNATAIGKLGNPGDDGGHLGAHRFFGDTPDEGIVPQVANLNRGAWKKMENEWADWVSRGFRVDYSIDVTPPGAIRPDSFEVEYTVTNPTTNEVVHRNWPEFENVSGQTFNRVSRGDMPTTESPGGAP